jgi:hypothetical protein
VELLKQEPYETYLKDINQVNEYSGNLGEEYTQKTIVFLKELAKKKLGIKKKRASGLELEEVKIEIGD